MAKVLCLGDIGIDFFKNQNKYYIGGCAYNVFYHLNNLGVQSQLMALLGEDEWSEIIFSRCLKAKFIKKQDKNLLLTIENTAQGEKKFLHYLDELLHSHRFNEVELSYLVEFDFIVAPYFLEIRKLLDEIVKHNSKKLILDLHEEESLNQAEFLELSKKVYGIHSGIKKYKDDFYEECSNNCSFISLTMGEEGSEFYRRGEKISHRDPSVDNVIDSTGAGDAYLAYLVKKIDGSINEETLRLASLYAQKTLQHYGATPDSLVK